MSQPMSKIKPKPGWYNKNPDKTFPYRKFSASEQDKKKAVDTQKKLDVIKSMIQPKRKRPVAPGGDRTEGAIPPGR